MSEETITTTDPLAAIRARWSGVAWRCDVERDGAYAVGAYLHTDQISALINLDEPSVDEIAFLQLAAQAPGDIVALLAEVDAARALTAELARALDLALGIVRGVMDQTDNVCPLCGARVASIGEKHRGDCPFNAVRRGTP